MSRHLAFFASFALIASIAFYFIYLSPLMADNFVFSRNIRPGFASFYAGEELTRAEPMSVASAFRQAAEMYETWCGRYLGNLLVYLLFMLSHWLYALLAALGFALYTILLHICVAGREWRQTLSGQKILLIAALLWLGLPSFGEAFFWLSVGGEIALLGQAAIFIPLRFYLDENEPGSNVSKTALEANLFFLAGLAVCSLDYPSSAVLPVAAWSCFFWLYWKKRQISLPILAGSLGLSLGGLITLAAPGNVCRLALTTDQSVHDYLAMDWGQRLISWLCSLPLAILWLWLPLSILACACLILFKKYRWNFCKFIPAPAWLFILAACLTTGSYLFTAWPPPRAFATAASQLIVAALIVWPQASKCASPAMLNLANKCRKLFCCVAVCLLCLEAVKFWSLHEQISAREQLILNSPALELQVPALPVNSGDRYWVLGKYLPDMSADPDFWVNRAVAAYYGLKKIAVQTSEKLTNYKDGQVRVRLENDRLHLEASDAYSGEGHLYYFGAPALLALFPDFLGRPVYDWLARAKPDSLRNYLVPLLLARTDVKISAGQGASMPLKIFARDAIWLAPLGSGRFSLDLLPLQRERKPVAVPES